MSDFSAKMHQNRFWLHKVKPANLLRFARASNFQLLVRLAVAHWHLCSIRKYHPDEST